jgi:hypothetical protein
VVLIGTFIFIIWAGHVPLMFMILGIQARLNLAAPPDRRTTVGTALPPVQQPTSPADLYPPLPSRALQTLMVKELFGLARVLQRERKLPGFRAQQWYFYILAVFWLYVRHATRPAAAPWHRAGACDAPSRPGCLAPGLLCPSWPDTLLTSPPLTSLLLWIMTGGDHE